MGDIDPFAAFGAVRRTSGGTPGTAQPSPPKSMNALKQQTSAAPPPPSYSNLQAPPQVFPQSNPVQPVHQMGQMSSMAQSFPQASQQAPPQVFPQANPMQPMQPTRPMGQAPQSFTPSNTQHVGALEAALGLSGKAPTSADPSAAGSFGAPSAFDVSDPFSNPNASNPNSAAAAAAAAAAFPTPAANDPFAPSNPAANDPFAPSNPRANDPFAPSNPRANDPFAPSNPAANDPFAPSNPAANDPFAPSNPAASDPFANPTPSNAVAADDPFSNPTPPARVAAQNGDHDDDDEEEAEAPAAPREMALSADGAAPAEKAAPVVLSRQDTFKYVEELATGNAQVKTDAARALKSLAFNANGEYKEGLIKSGVPRLLMMMINEGSSAASLEQATSCMYSMAREHMESKQALVAAGALRALSTTLLNYDSKQCQLNSCATLYAISCAGRDVCKQLAAFRPLQRLTFLVNPGPGRSAQDDQLQLFAALLIVNLLHVKGVTSKEERVSLGTSLQRAYDDATESQVRETIAVGLKRLSSMGSRKSQLKQRLSSLALGGSRKADSGPSSSGVGGGGAPTATSYSSAPPPRLSSSSSSSMKGAIKGLGRALSSKPRKPSNYRGSDAPDWGS